MCYAMSFLIFEATKLCVIILLNKLNSHDKFMLHLTKNTDKKATNINKI